jgi:hypothetical protein
MFTASAAAKALLCRRWKFSSDTQLVLTEVHAAGRSLLGPGLTCSTTQASAAALSMQRHHQRQQERNHNLA